MRIFLLEDVPLEIQCVAVPGNFTRPTSRLRRFRLLLGHRSVYAKRIIPLCPFASRSQILLCDDRSVVRYARDYYECTSRLARQWQR